MSTRQTFPCPYYSTINGVKATTCIACGAPIEPPKLQPTKKPRPVLAHKPEPKPRPEEQLRKIGEKTDDMYFTVLNTYAVAWRTLAEAIVIALCGFVLGLVGGATEMHWVGVLGGLVVGICVGWVRKNFYMTLASAPVGLILGLALGGIIWATGGSPQLLVIAASLLALAAALIGGRPQPPYQRRNIWEKIRPLLGGIGGLIFSIPGMLIGWGLVATINNLL